MYIALPTGVLSMPFANVLDAVAHNKKVEARSFIVNALNQYQFGRSERLVRINPVGSGFEKEDIETVCY